MVSEKLKGVLRSKTDLNDEEINKLTESEGWALIYSIEKSERELREQNKLPEICFTGFGKSDRERLSEIATKAKFLVKDSVTKSLSVLVTGENAGESKIKKAESQGCTITNEKGFLEYIESLNKNS